MELEQSKDFNNRLGQWVANQGFWFQLRYSMSGKGGVGSALYHLLKMLSRLAIIMLILAIGGLVYLLKRPGTKGFREDFVASLTEGLSTSKTEISNVARDQGSFNISKLTCTGHEDSFYTTLEARTIRGKMGLIDGVIGKWNLGVVTIFKLNLDLNAGADDAKSAASIAKSLFKHSANVELSALDITDATLHWGYSERTNGAVENSNLKVQRLPGLMKLSFKGGTFSQNWLKKLDIVEMVINCTPEGFTFEKAVFRKGTATVDFSGLKVVGGERPTVSGLVKIRRLLLEDILPSAARSFLEGSISGDFTVSGSTNSIEGIGFDGQVRLDGQDSVTVRERLPILKALSDVDYVRNYYRVNFRSGAFHLKTTRGELTISELKLKSDDEISMGGHLRVRLPTAEEAKAAFQKNQASKGSSDGQDKEEAEPKATAKTDEVIFSLAQAAKNAKREKELADVGGKSILKSDSLSDAAAAQLLAEQASDRLAKSLRYEGEFQITLPPDAFEIAPKLMEKFPVDPKIGRIPFTIPLTGDLFELTDTQAKEIYQLRSR
jgi:hypothetical protein